MSPRLVGLAGYAQAGKNTVADMMKYDVQLAFADPLRQMMEELNPLVEMYNEDTTVPFRRYNDVVAMKGYEWAKANTSARQFMINLGGGARRVINPLIWVEAAVNQIDHALDLGALVVVTDVRYPNESDALKRMGGEVWYVQREGVGPVGPEEAEQMDLVLRKGIHRMIENNGTLEDLQAEVDKALGR